MLTSVTARQILRVIGCRTTAAPVDGSIGLAAAKVTLSAPEERQAVHRQGREDDHHRRLGAAQGRRRPPEGEALKGSADEAPVDANNASEGVFTELKGDGTAAIRQAKKRAAQKIGTHCGRGLVPEPG
ncbi:hypothetical protein [Streptomyces sp. NPDC127197]|uniref:hypothetical protein n=1 Tax=Streptomyces sp. NPDC127197 TaxID=3345388 RepID=UPI003630CFD2